MALEEIYRAHFGFVWAVLRRLGVSDADLEDVAQDVFVVVHRRLPEFEGRATTRTWLYAIAVRVAWNHLRRRRHREPAAEASATGLVAPKAASDPEEHALRTEAGRVLDEVLGRLDDDKRAVFVLSDIEGLTANEIAAIVGTNPRTVYSRLRAARDRVHGDLARMQSRERSAADRRTWLRTATEGDRPGAQIERRVWAALALRLPTSAATGAAVAATGAAAWSGAVQALTVSLALGAAGLGTLWVAAAPLREEAAASSTASSVAATSDDTARPDARPRARTPATDPRPVADGRRAHDAPAKVADDAEAPSVPAEASAVAARPPAPPPVDRDTPADPLVQELALLEAARDALDDGHAERSLPRLDDHARRFPTSALATDRARLRARARCDLGRVEEAARAARDGGIASPCPRED